MEQNKIYDVTFKCPFNCIIAGASGSGKTRKILKFLENKDIICNAKFYKVHYFYSLWQPLYDEMKQMKLVDNFIEDIPHKDDLFSLIDSEIPQNSLNPPHQLLIFDDLMINLEKRKDNLMSQLMTVFAHHKNLSVILVSQMLFKPGDNKYSVLTEHIHYLFFLKIPRNSSKIIHLAEQIALYNIGYIVETYKNAKNYHILTYFRSYTNHTDKY